MYSKSTYDKSSLKKKEMARQTIGAEQMIQGAVQLEGLVGQAGIEFSSREPCPKQPKSNLDKTVGDGLEANVICAPVR